MNLTRAKKRTLILTIACIAVVAACVLIYRHKKIPVQPPQPNGLATTNPFNSSLPIDPNSPAFLSSLTQQTGGEETAQPEIVGISSSNSPSATKPVSQPQPATKVADPNLYFNTPLIGSLSSTVFGNGDTITIKGKNFTNSNIVLLSIDFPGKFTDIHANKEGTQLQFTVNLSISNKFDQSLSNLDPAVRTQVIGKIIAAKSKNSSYKNGWYMPATIQIENELGRSNTVPVSVDIMKGV